jgi:2,4-dienoyl-CoA reductase-like NADH-dependent reductase (Old Yellow Enzyme family)
METLFSSLTFGNAQIKNRFVHSATYEAMASESGEVTDSLLKRYKLLAQGDIGLIIPGHMYVHTLGKAGRFQIGIYSDELIPGLKRLVDTVHEEGSMIFFQLSHAGRQTRKQLIGRQPLGPSGFDRDPMYLVRAGEMNVEQIKEFITAYGKAARRAVEAGADGIQLHAAHGYLINQFLSPYFNRRKDDWGGSDGNRFRFLKEVVLACREHIPEKMPLGIKLNTQDFTPREGITPALAAKYAGWIKELAVDGLELSSGSTYYAAFNMSRGDVPLEDLVQGMPGWKKPLGRMALKKMLGKYDLKEGYNLDAAKLIRPRLNGTTLAVVGGFRSLAHMEETVQKGHADLISMSRPFIREPFILRKFREGKQDRVSCRSCNKCLAAAANEIPVRCFNEQNS